MSLADHLSASPTATEQQYTPKTEFDGSAGFIQTGPMPATEQPPDYVDILRQFGYDPTQVRIVGSPRIARWEVAYREKHYDDLGKPVNGDLETRWLASYRFYIAPVADLVTVADVETIARRARVERRAGTGPHWFVFQAGDMQIGKISRDGATDEILARYFQSLEAAKDEFAALKRHGIEGIQVSMPGDCIEGNQSQKGRNMRNTEQTITEQLLIFQRLLMYTAEAFAPLAERVFVDVVNGNHDEAQREPVETYPGDGWATTAAALMSDALKLNPLALGHVEVRVPEKWSGQMTVPVGDTVVTVVHGHQWRRDKSFDWWAGQAIGNHPPGAAQIMQHGHWHEWQVRSNADRTVVGSPTFDCGSDWYRNIKGGSSKRGAAAYLLRNGEVSRMSIL